MTESWNHIAMKSWNCGIKEKLEVFKLTAMKLRRVASQKCGITGVWKCRSVELQMCGIVESQNIEIVESWSGMESWKCGTCGSLDSWKHGCVWKHGIIEFGNILIIKSQNFRLIES